MEGRLHIYHPRRRLNLFEYTPLPSGKATKRSSQTPPNILLFIGGLFDNFQSPGYVGDLARLFPRYEGQRWTVMQVQLSSAMKCWGISELDRDVDEISTCVSYIRDTILPKQTVNVVLMGHSTGCQDTLHYLTYFDPHSPLRTDVPLVQGAILQAPVSDREAVLQTARTNPSSKASYDECIDLASKTPQKDHKDTIIPLSWTVTLLGPAPVSIARFLSLVSPTSPETPSTDDYFSSDLSDHRFDSTFGRIGLVNTLRNVDPRSRPSLLVLMSGDDEAVPKSIDKAALMARWRSSLASQRQYPITLHTESLVIPDAKHDVSGDGQASKYARLVKLRGAVLRYLSDMVEKISEDNVAFKILEGDAKQLEGEHKL